MDRGHKKLDVWKEGIELASEIYRVTASFPRSEVFGLTSQMRRAVVSIPSNIAEGAARASRKEFVHFLQISGGSLSELDTQIEIAANLGYVVLDRRRDLEIRVISLSKKLAGLIKSVNGE